MARRVQLNRTFEKIRVYGHDSYIASTITSANELDGPSTVDRTQRVAYLDENRFCNPHFLRRPETRRERLGLRMVLVAAIE